MGVDRVTDAIFSFGAGNGQNNDIFTGGDNLWKSMKSKMIQFINANGGKATAFNNITPKINWDDVKDYLKGIITWEELKTKLGC